MTISPSTYIHNKRLKIDFESMSRLSCSAVQWRSPTEYDVNGGSYPTKYIVTYKIPAPTVDNRVTREHQVEFDVSSLAYPINAQVVAKFTTPWLIHPHIYSDGRVCIGALTTMDSLGAICLRVAGFFLYDPILINRKSIATASYMIYYDAHKNELPIEKIVLPTIDTIGPTFDQPTLKVIRRQ